jgi:phage-related protein
LTCGIYPTIIQKGGNRFITHGFIKKSDKVPAKEIGRALKYKEDWMRRNADEVQ